MALSNIAVLKKFFESGPDARPLNMDELKKVTAEERAELAVMAGAALGLTKNEKGEWV